MQSRREWFKSSIGLGGLIMAPSILTAEEIKKYNPRPVTNIVKLSSNENPYGPSERVRNAIKDSFGDACRYPYEYILELQKTLAKKHNVSPESIVITGGSNEALRVTGLAVADDGGEIIAGQPTYLALMSYAEAWGGKIKWVPVDSNKGYDLGKIEEAIDAKIDELYDIEAEIEDQIRQKRQVAKNIVTAKTTLASIDKKINRIIVIFHHQGNVHDRLFQWSGPRYVIQTGENISF